MTAGPEGPRPSLPHGRKGDLRCLAIASAAVALAFSLAPDGRASPPRFGVSAFWWTLGTCETGHIGDPSDGQPRFDWGARRRHLEGTSYEGFVGFAASTWRLWAGHLGLTGRYPHAYDAPPLVQVRVARYGLSVGGSWGCLR